MISVVVYGFVSHPGHAAERVDAELSCLALTVYHESRGEPEFGKLAVAHVVMNRAKNERFPRTICDVVYQSGADGDGVCEFSWTCDTVSDQPEDLTSWQNSVRIARLVYWGSVPDPTNGAMWYHADYVEPEWAATLGAPQRLGRHLFYRVGAERSTVLASIPQDTRLVARKALATGVTPENPALRLPEATTEFLLEMRVTMIVYVADRQDRAVRINDTMYRQGEELAPGLILASITSTMIVVKYEDRWFRFVL